MTPHVPLPQHQHVTVPLSFSLVPPAARRGRASVRLRAHDGRVPVKMHSAVTYFPPQATTTGRSSRELCNFTPTPLRNAPMSDCSGRAAPTVPSQAPHRHWRGGQGGGGADESTRRWGQRGFVLHARASSSPGRATPLRGLTGCLGHAGGLLPSPHRRDFLFVWQRASVDDGGGGGGGCRCALQAARSAAGIGGTAPPGTGRRVLTPCCPSSINPLRRRLSLPVHAGRVPRLRPVAVDGASGGPSPYIPPPPTSPLPLHLPSPCRRHVAPLRAKDGASPGALLRSGRHACAL